jgi:hypothetical protein
LKCISMILLTVSISRAQRSSNVFWCFDLDVGAALRLLSAQALVAMNA